MQALIEMIFSLRATGLLLAGGLVLLGGAPASAQCRPPHFRKGQDYGASIFVSIQSRDFTLDKLACLAQTLRGRRPDYKSFWVFFFDSDEAAKYFQPPVEGYPPRWPKWAKGLHAMYSFEADKEDRIEILPMGYNSVPSSVTSIDLPLVAATRCRLAVQDRCLIAAMERIAYPQEALKTRTSGVIVLKGTVKRDGRVTGLRVARADTTPDQEKGRLADAALKDLRTWRFDAAGHDDPIQIVYSFAVETAPIGGGSTQVQWVPPNQVEVRTTVPEPDTD